MRKLTYLFAIVALCLLASCGDSSRRDFNRLLVELAAQDGEVSAQDWSKVTAYLDSNRDHFDEFYEDGKLDTQAVKTYIVDFFKKRRPPMTIRFVGIDGSVLKFHFFIERSGSMRAYDSPQGDGSFRTAVLSMENGLSGKPRVDSIGEKGYTDYRKIFSDLLNKTRGDEVSVLVTDMIYSVRGTDGVNPQKVFNEAQEMVRSVFKDQVRQMSMLVVRMSGSYNGPYYSYDNSVHPFNGRRPYYIILVTSNDNMARLTEDANLHTFADFKSLKGYESMCLFTASPLYAPYASFMLSGKEVSGRFRPEHGQDGGVTSLEDVEPDRGQQGVKLALAVDLSGMLIDDAYLCDPHNYEVTADDDVKLTAIRPITKADRTPAEKKYLGRATHLFLFSVPRVTHGQTVTLRLLNRLPLWVGDNSAENDLVPDNHSTFGLRYLMQGIYDSYSRNATGTPAYFELKLKLDD